MKKAYVIGAGPLGLSAALELTNNGYSVVVIDALSKLGGLTQPFDFEGDLAELYYHFYYAGDHLHATSFLEMLIPDVQVEWKDISTENFVDGEFVDFDSPLSLLRTAGIDSWRLVWTLLKAKFFAIDSRLDKVTALDWAEEAFGSRFFNAVWKPLLLNKFGAYAGNVSAYWLATRIKRHMSTKVGKGGRCRFGYLTSTYEPFFEVLRKRVIAAGGSFELGQRIKEITVSENRVTGLLTDVGEILVEPGAPVFSCVPLGNLKNIGTVVNALPYLDKFDLVGAVLLILKIRRRLSDAYWTTVSDPSIPFDVVIQQNRLYANSEYEIVYLSRYHDRSSAVFQADEKVLQQDFTSALLSMYPHLTPDDVLATKLVRTQSAAPVPTVDMLNRLPSYRSSLENFYHAGFEHIYPEDRGVGNSVLVGRKLISAYLSEVPG
jgi:protoporphyrinogen oxidase